MAGSTQGDLGDALTLAGDEPSPSASASAWRLDRGAMLGRYVVLARLGEGGMGVVYSAYDPELDRKVALKLLHRPEGPARGGTSGRSRLLREAQAMAKLSHPNVVAVHDVGTVDDRVFVALELVDGRTLTEWRREAPRGWREVVDVMQRAGRGLAAAHAAGLLHRDFKPDNVLIDVEGRVRVMDFGLARALDSDIDARKSSSPPSPMPEGGSMGLSVTRLLGTPAYMAPEQLAHGPIDARTDVFAFGVSLWELVYGARPFAGESLPELAANVLAGRIVAPPRDSHVPAWVRRIAARAIARAPDERWPSMDALLDALSRDPAKKRVRAAIVLAAVLTPVGLLAAYRIDEHRTERACAQRGESTGDVWNADASARARAGLVASGAPYASTTWEKTRPWIDQYTGALAAVRVQTCRDADIEETISADRRARIDRCLDERERELAAMLEGLAHADAQTVEDAVMTASTLTRVQTCHDDRVLAAADHAPEAARSSADEMLREAFMLQQQKRRDEALALDRTARDLAREDGNAVLEATAELRISKLLEHAGDPAGAEAAAKAAYFVAGSAGVDDVSAEAANALVRIVGLTLGRAPEGLEWARHADMIHARIGTGQLSTREIDLVDTVAQIHRTTGDVAAARREHERALQLVELGFGPQHPRSARVLNNLGLDDIALGEYAAALEKYARAADLVERTLGTDHPTYATILVNTAVAHYGLGDHDAALAEHRRALEIMEAQLGPEHPDLAASLNGIGSIHFDRGELELAREYFERTFQIVARTRPPGHGDIATMATNLGSVYEDLGQHARALELHTQALAIWEELYGPDHRDVAVALNNLAAAHFALEAFDDAGREHRRALAIRERVYGKDNPELVSSLLGVGLVDVAQGRGDAGLELLRRALEIADRHTLSGSSAIHVRDQLGRALVLTGRDPVRGHALVVQARAEASRLGNAQQVADIDTWLSENPPPAPG